MKDNAKEKPSFNPSADEMAVAVAIYRDTVNSAKFRGNPARAAAEAHRLAEVFVTATKRLAAGEDAEDLKQVDPFEELDDAYCPNLPAYHPLNRCSRYMPGPNPGELVTKPDLKAALEDARAVRKMTAGQRQSEHKRAITEMEALQRQRGQAELQRVADDAKKNLVREALALGSLED